MVKPPFPTEKGLWGKPTVINNGETLACVPLITPDSGAEFRSWGTAQCPGTKLFCVSGHVNKPGVYELPMGATVSECIDKALGVRGYLKALQIGGTAGPIYDQKALVYPWTSYRCVRRAECLDLELWS
jgi:NADH-quinone oxidoreductase subunit F